MRVDITGRHVDITPALEELIASRLAKIERLLGDRLVSATVVLTREKFRRETELVVHARADHILKGQGEGTAWPVSIRQAAAKVEHQALKLKSKYGDRKRAASGTREIQGEKRAPGPRLAGPRIPRAKRYPVKPMSVEDAALRLEGAAESFVVFRNADTEAVGILFRRKDGSLGLIEPD